MWPVKDELDARLSALRPTIHELMSIASIAGLSLGVVHNDKLIHTANFGFRDMARSFRWMTRPSSQAVP